MTIVCNPALRSQWFNRISSEAREQAEALFLNVFHSYKNDMPSNESETPSASAPTKATETSSFLNSAFVFKSSLSGPTPQDDYYKNEFNRYIQFENPASDLYYPLDWWRVSRLFDIGRNFHVYLASQTHEKLFPVIARIARDYLAILATSVSVERLFSLSKYLCTETRSSLKPQTITQTMCNKQWIREGLFDI